MIYSSGHSLARNTVFHYLRDPLFLFCVTIYFVNRWVLKPSFDVTFLHAHFNDLLCLPLWLPILAWLMRRTGLRRHDLPPTAEEFFAALLVWSVVFELFLPYTAAFEGVSIADYWDIFWYALGGLAAAVWWQWWYDPRPPSSPAVEADDRS